MCKTKCQVLWSESWAVLEGLWVHAQCSFTLETNITTVVQKLSQHVLMGSPVCSHRLNVNVWKEAESNRSASMQSWNLHWTVVPLNFVKVSDGGLEVLCTHLFLFSHAGSSPWRRCACCACWRQVWLCSCLLIPGEIRSGHRLEVLQVVFLDCCYPLNSLWRALTIFPPPPHFEENRTQL